MTTFVEAVKNMKPAIGPLQRAMNAVEKMDETVLRESLEVFKNFAHPLKALIEGELMTRELQRRSRE
jgi:hypothetical protein